MGADFYIGTEMVGASTYVGDVGGAFMVRFGGGAHYYILKNIGLGF